MKPHIQIVAALHVEMGALSLLAAIGIFAFLGIAGTVVVANGDREAAGIIGVVAVVIGGVLAVLSLPGNIGSWALFTGRSWARPLVLVLGAFHLLSFPIGTALGVYTFWALLYTPVPAATTAPAVRSL